MFTSQTTKKRTSSEASFTLLETIIALGLMTFLILEVGSVQGNAVFFSDYSRKVVQATWLAKRILSQVQYQANIRDFKDLETQVPETPFEDMPEFSYKLEIKEWKFPIMDFLTKVMSGNKGDDKDGGGGSKASPLAGMADMVQTAISQILNDQVLKTVYVEVSWAEGAKRNNTSLSYLIANQRDLDKFILTLKPAYDKLKAGQPPPNTTGGKPPGTQPGTGGSGTRPTPTPTQPPRTNPGGQ